MSGHEKKPDPFLEERQEAQQQNGVLDAVTDMTRLSVPFGPFHQRGIHFGSTNFEGYDLNDMVDIVESANPELLESAAEALVQARDAIRTAAEELHKDIGGVDWKGESNTAFTKWADSLVKTAEGIADYADVVGTQVLAASSGLASVRKSMPPRDTRTDRKTVDDIPAVAQVDGNADYTAALKAEKDRQEAINQMYRLASYYTVSADTMQSAEEPVFPKMPDVGVPGPTPGFGNEITVGSNETPAGRVPKGEVHASPAGAETEQSSKNQLPTPTGADTSIRPSVGTELNSIGTLPPPESTKPVASTPPSTANPVNTGNGAPQLPGAVPPVLRGTTGRSTGPGGMPAAKLPSAAQGRATSATGSGPTARPGTVPPAQAGHAASPGSAVGRGMGPTGQVGHAAGPGQARNSASGTTARGVVGGMPRSTGAVGQVGGAPRGPMAMGSTPPSRGASGRGPEGVVGGRPVTGATPSGQNSKLPRGMVIGGERAPDPRTDGQRPGQRGVIGTPPTTSNGGQASRRPGGVVGNGRGPGNGRPRRDERRDNKTASD
ncbi:hypothetical protein SUDANB130_01712 [Streptomyces sp. enrichment culture]|uniref:Uncharacterized protein n=2 Tax=Streptomyces griseorubens TaxID=66897 RepID=A0ABR4SXX8_9ACTN|nr:hypothetical protein DJ64_13720 [Streptomyces griseorubens]